MKIEFKSKCSKMVELHGIEIGKPMLPTPQHSERFFCITPSHKIKSVSRTPTIAKGLNKRSFVTESNTKPNYI